MFKKSTVNKELDLFTSPSMTMCKREIKFYNDDLQWHNQFFKKVTSQIDEEVFRPLYTEKKFGAPTKCIRQLVAMNILKEGTGCSDEQLFENCRYNLLWRKALGLFNLNEECPSQSLYYQFRRAICEYEAKSEKHINLFENCFKKLTAQQIKSYNISGRTIRMDSKLICSNIAWYHRYQIIHETLVLSISEEDIVNIGDQVIRQLIIGYIKEDAQKVIYRTESEAMGSRLHEVGVVIYTLLQSYKETDKVMLRRVFNEQYEVSPDGEVTLRDKALISPTSLQNPHDPDAVYHKKRNTKVKGYSVNITETCDEEGKPNMVTNVQVRPANVPDKDFMEEAVKGTNEVTNNKVEKVHADGAYISSENRNLSQEVNNGFEFIPSGLKGTFSRYDLNLNEDGILEVTDNKTNQTIIARKVSEHRWRIPITDDKSKQSYRYFDDKAIENCKNRHLFESIPQEEKNKRNNVEATIFQYSFHTRNNKTRYRGLLKHALQALARCAWINMRRLFLYDLKMAAEIA